MSSFTYERRLATFDHFNWPHSLAKTGNKEKFKSQPEDFAQAGFYCRPLVGSDDTVACFLCLKNLDGWERTDSAWQEHKSHCATCPLVTLNLTASRLRTFDKWSGARVKGGPSSLADAGFFHFPKTDSDDTCICFQCGLALDGWESEDDPLHEHSRRRPNCPWIAKRQFIQPASFEFILAGKSDECAVKDIFVKPPTMLVSSTPSRAQLAKRTPSKIKQTPSKAQLVKATPSKATPSKTIKATPSKIRLSVKQTPKSTIKSIDGENRRTPSKTGSSKKPAIAAASSSAILHELRRLFPQIKPEEVLNWTMQDLLDRLIREKVDKFDYFLKHQQQQG